MHKVDTVIIGAGAVGLAIARAIAQAGREILVLEAADTFGMGISARNSEVIHAGIYYPKNSLKARLCVAGRALLYAFCDRYGIEYRRCGKLIVATGVDPDTELERIRLNALSNGVELSWLDRVAAQQMEPALYCTGALYSPFTGIINARAYMTALLGQAEQAGAIVANQTRVSAGWIDHESVTLSVNDELEPTLVARRVINCAGLNAPRVAASFNGFPREHVPRAYFAKGNYFSLNRRAPFSRLIYPVPEAAGLGVHLTLDLGGQARFGPDVEWVDGDGMLNYDVDSNRVADFYSAIRKYWPGIPDGSLVPAYAGIRPKISGPDEAAADFRIDGPDRHGIATVTNLFGIESPGLTASLAIANEVLRRTID
jgi:L-2-hydroxyglutarate oxidase LhgO